MHAKVYCAEDKYADNREATEEDPGLFTATRLLLAVWVCVGLVPLLLQARSFVKFVSPHKINQLLVASTGTASETLDLDDHCPVEGLMVAGVWWNVGSTHYFTGPQGRLCHFVVPQYNIHGSYLLGADRVAPSPTTPASCSGESYPFEHYFYHGSIGYYAFYEEASGTYCAKDQTAYVEVNGLGTYDCNGAALAKDGGDALYRRSYWYGMFGAVWIAYRTILIRRSYVSCKRFGRRCDNMQETLRVKGAVVYVQESLRLSAHGARNYHRAMLLYLLVEGLMSDLFMLIAQDGFFAKVQYISLGYNLSGLLSMLFEMLESMHWLSEQARCFMKRLLFNYETAMVGEFFCAAAMQYYLTSLNRSSLKQSQAAAQVASYYMWSLVGHGVIVLGIVAAITSIRATGAIVIVGWKHGSLKLLTSPCCVDTTLGIHCKMVLLGGFVWEDGKLHYKVETLKSFGVMKMEGECGLDFFVVNKIFWLSIPRQDMVVIGKAQGHRVRPCSERPCTGVIGMFGESLGGAAAEGMDSAQTMPSSS